MADRSDLSHYIPRRIDDQPKFLFWDRDIALVCLVGVFAGIATGFPLFGICLGIGAAYGYGKLKTGKHPGMAAHLLYWHTGIPELKELPPSHIRELNG